MPIVVDASVAVKCLVPEPDTPAAMRLLNAKSELLAPDILWVELASATCKKVRQGEIPLEGSAEILKDFRSLPIKTYSSDALVDTALRVALEAGISVYDAVYLSLAYRHDCSLVTADKKLHDRVRLVYPQAETVWLGNFKG